MKRAPLLFGVGLAALACCAQAFALSRADGAVAARIVQGASIEIVSPLVLPSVTATAVAPNAGATPARPAGSTPGAAPLSNATLTISGQAGDAVSMAVPQSFTVVRAGGTEALTVKTNTNAEFGLSSDGVVLAGAIMGGNTMSVNVGGAISLASSEPLAPGAYEGLLVVVVQYN